MENQYNKVKANTPRKVYLDLNHTLVTPWELSHDSEVDAIHCKIAGRKAWRIARDFKVDYLAYCSECIELFDPGYNCARITVPDEEPGVTIVILVR